MIAPEDPTSPAEPTGIGGAGAPASANAPAPGPPGWAWVRPAPVLQAVETEPLEYHRLYRGARNYRWWKPMLVLVLAAVFYATLSIALSGIWVGIITAQQPDLFMTADPIAATEALTAQLMLDTQNPLSVLMNLLNVILMIPSVILAMLCLGVRPVGRVWSVAGRLRWRLLWRAVGFAVIGVVVMNGVGMLVEAIASAVSPAAAVVPAAEQTTDFDVNAALLSMVFVLLLVPFQATAEEVVFRGLGMQVIGSWLRNPWFGILIPSICFALAHIYDLWGMAAVGLMGLVAAWLTWRTGGLEAAIAIHVINNLVAFGFMASGVTGETAQVSDTGGAGSLIGQVAGLGVFVWLVQRSFVRRGDESRSRIDVIQTPMQAPAALVPVAPQRLDDAAGSQHE